MPELFIEIGTEEIPASYVPPAFQYLERELTSFFEKNRVQAGTPRAMGSPRRLVVSFPRVAERQKDVVETHHGPNVKVAFDAQGRPTKAAIGFARGRGIDVSALERAQTPKGEVVCARVEQIGQPTGTLLSAYLPQLFRDIPFPKKMRWGSHSLAFARPVQWIAALFGGKVLEITFDTLKSGDVSWGHRFLKPKSFKVRGLTTYLRQCEKHFLVVDPEERKRFIQEQVRMLADQVCGVVEDDPDLLDQVNYLVEYPVAIRGDFESRFLELPKELLTITMKHHQRYFPVSGKDGKLLPHFITISNMPGDDGDEIKRGNERVLRARLEDARFFFDEDRKKSLDDWVEQLKGVVFQKNLGTSYEKMERFSALAEELAKEVCPQCLSQVKRAARICKADLVSQMVYEFPELQGIMGNYYAAHAGEDKEVARAIEEHYWPAFAGDRLPSSPVGAVVAVADKLDTILGCISVGLIPSGSEDPYGLRRGALGIIQIFLDRGWQVSLNRLIDKGIQALAGKAKLSPDEVRSHTQDLFVQRYKSLLSNDEFPYDAIDSVLSTGIDSLVDVKQKVIALSELKKQPHFEPLAIVFRRVVSILTDEAQGDLDSSLLKEPQEKKLCEEFQRVREPVQTHVQNKEFPQALEKIVEIKPAVDEFFDHVMVMVKDDILRKNRMRLLYNVSTLFSQLADFSKIVLKKS